MPMELSAVSGSETSYTSQVNLGPLLTTQFTNTRSDQKKAKAVSEAIDKSIKADKERQQKEGGIKLLILGKHPAKASPYLWGLTIYRITRSFSFGERLLYQNTADL